MWRMTQQSSPDDFVIATGKTHSVKDFLETALEVAGLGNAIEKYVTFDADMKRPAEVDLLVGDSSKARQKLGWEAKVNFKDLIALMVENDLRLESFGV